MANKLDIPKIYNDPIISRKRTGDAINPYKRIKESITLDKLARALLTEIPNKEDRVKVLCLGEELYEVEDEFLSENTFRVDYPNGIVYFHESLANKTLNFEYTGEGVYLFPDSRVYSTDGEFLTVKDKLKDLDRAILVERHRIDEQILSHPQPSEVVDMRIDYNGKRYRVAKDRIDAEQRKIEEAYVDAKGKRHDSLKKRIDALELATEESINLLNGEIVKLESSIELIPDKIELKVSELRKEINGELNLLQSSITMFSDEIELKVSKNDIISSINLSPESIRIKGKLIHLDGETRIDNGIIKSAMIESVSASKITAGIINANDIKIHGGNENIFTTIEGSKIFSSDGSSDTTIDGGKIASTGSFVRTFKDNRTAYYKTLITSGDGVYRIAVLEKNDSEGNSLTTQSELRSRGLYLHDKGISTQPDNFGESLNQTGRYIDFFARETYDSGFTRSGLKIFSDSRIDIETSLDTSIVVNSDSSLHLESRQSSIYIAPQKNTRVGNNQFQFYVVDSSSSAHTDGVLAYGSTVSGMVTGIRFSKNANDPRITISGHLTVGGNITAHNFINANPAYSVYFGVGGAELAVTNNNLAAGGNPTYRPVRASNFYQSSSKSYKVNIEIFNKSALDVINKLTVVEYDLKEDIKNNIYDNRQVGLISEDSKEVATRDGMAIDLYKLSSYNTKAIQELYQKYLEYKNEVEKLNKKIIELENKLN